jgi:hypothetical protein
VILVVTSDDKDVMRYLMALGMPKNCVKFTVTAEIDRPITAEATFYPDLIGNELTTRRFILWPENAGMGDEG